MSEDKGLMQRKYTFEDLNRDDIDSLGADQMQAIGEQIIMTETGRESQDEAEQFFNRNIQSLERNGQMSFGRLEDPLAVRPRKSTRKGRFFNRGSVNRKQ